MGDVKKDFSFSQNLEPLKKGPIQTNFPLWGAVIPERVAFNDPKISAAALLRGSKQ